MLTADTVHRSGRVDRAGAARIADQWNAAYPVMREVATSFIDGMRASIRNESWKVDPKHPHAEFLRQCTPSEADIRARLKSAEDLRRELGQLDRGTHRACTRSVGGFSPSYAYTAVRSLLDLTSLNSTGLAVVYRLMATLSLAHDETLAALKASSWRTD